MNKKTSILPLLLAFVPFATAATIIQAVDNSSPNSMQLDLPGSAVTAAGVVSWTQTVGFANVSVSAYIFSEAGPDGTPGDQYTAYLTNKIGAGTTAANQVANPVTNFAAPFDAPVPGTPALLFSGLTLGPGTYYLVIQSLNNSPSGLLWESKAGLAPTFGAGVSGGNFSRALSDGSVGQLNGAFAPASDFPLMDIGGSVMYAVTGEAAANDGVPEPASRALAGLGLIAIGVTRRLSPRHKL